jgi:hypothetical protein
MLRLVARSHLSDSITGCIGIRSQPHETELSHTNSPRGDSQNLSEKRAQPAML